MVRCPVIGPDEGIEATKEPRHGKGYKWTDKENAYQLVVCYIEQQVRQSPRSTALGHHPLGPEMILGDMRELGVRPLSVTRDLFPHRAMLSADRWGTGCMSAVSSRYLTL